MNPQDAGELVHMWLAAHQDTAVVHTHSGPVSRAIRELAPDGHPYGVGQTPSGPAMLVLLDASLLVFSVTAESGTALPVRARLVQLDSGCRLEVTEVVGERPAAAMVHVWQVRAGDLDVQIAGGEIVQPDADGGRDPNERLGRAIAEKLGWKLP